MENDNQQSPAIEQAAKPKVGVTFRIDTRDLENFKAICASRGISQAKQFVEWIRTAEPCAPTSITNPSTNDIAI